MATTNEPILRYTPPGRYDVAQFGTMCRVVGDNDSSEIYVQLSEDMSSPSWQKLSKLLEFVFSRFVEKPDFVSRCSLVFSGQGDAGEHLKMIGEIINRYS
jgi:hypothetical protein